MRDILQQDGALLFWSHGLMAGTLRDFWYSGVRTGMYPTVRDAIHLAFSGSSPASSSQVSLLEKIAAGATTGSVGAGLANAFDVVRVRMICEGGRVDAGKLLTGLRAGQKPRWGSSFHCLRDAVRNEGFVHGLLLRGVGASMSRAGLLTAAQMSTYDHTKTMAKRHGIVEGTALHVSAALLSGLAAAAACNPADVVKSRIMSGSDHGGRSMLTTAWHIAAHEGPIGFYRGFIPNYARLGPTILIQLPIAEALRRSFGVQAL